MNEIYIITYNYNLYNWKMKNLKSLIKIWKSYWIQIFYTKNHEKYFIMKENNEINWEK